MNDARSAWDANAGFWDERMGEGNEFFSLLIWPATERLLGSVSGKHVLDVACGNGVSSRRLAAAGAKVVGFDFSERMLDRARARTRSPDVEYRLLDATDEQALSSLGRAAFDAAICNMALMDIGDIGIVMAALAVALRPGAPFVVSVLHPCFNNPSSIQMAELEDRAGELVTTYSIKTSRYARPFTQPGIAIPGQPTPHPYFHRPLSLFLAPAFAAGFVVDALDEPTFEPDVTAGTTPLSWSGRFSEIPPVLIARLRRSAD
jgi:2-polyprenyl-3-methyl-5-hydroxy-6-metoxy-1,4-benzoquinol methylase